MTTTATLSIGKSQALLGLRWEELVGGSRGKPSAEAVQLAKKNAAGHGCVLIVRQGTGRSMVGLVPSASEDSRRATKAVSGAVWLAGSVSAPTILCAHIRDDLFWICVIQRPGSLTIDADQVLRTTQAAARLERAFEDLARTGVTNPQVVIYGQTAPSAEVFHGTEPRILDNLVELLGEEPPPDARIRQLQGVRMGPLLVAAGVVGLIGIALIGKMWLDKRALEEQQAAEASMMPPPDFERLRQQRIEEAVRAALDAQLATPAPREAMDGCYAAYLASGLRVAGWVATSVECVVAARQATVVYERRADWATNDGLAAALDEAGVAYVLDSTGQRVVIALPMTDLEVRATQPLEALPTSQDAIRQLGTLVQMGMYAFRRAGTGFSGMLEPAAPASVTFQEPSLEGSGDPNEFQQVPAEQSFGLGLVRVLGAGTSFDEIALDSRFVVVERVALRSLDNGGASYEVEARYVVQN